jgi:hypothetical protein
LKAEKNEAICCVSTSGPHFRDIGVYHHCNANAGNLADCFGPSYTNDTGLDGKAFFTGSEFFKVKEMEVFEMIY